MHRSDRQLQRARRYRTSAPSPDQVVRYRTLASRHVQRILDLMTITPAYVRNGRLDILAANRLGQALFSPVLTSPAWPANPAPPRKTH